MPRSFVLRHFHRRQGIHRRPGGRQRNQRTHHQAQLDALIALAPFLGTPWGRVMFKNGSRNFHQRSGIGSRRWASHSKTKTTADRRGISAAGKGPSHRRVVRQAGRNSCRIWACPAGGTKCCARKMISSALLCVCHHGQRAPCRSNGCFGWEIDRGHQAHLDERLERIIHGTPVDTFEGTEIADVRRLRRHLLLVPQVSHEDAPGGMRKSQIKSTFARAAPG